MNLREGSLNVVVEGKFPRFPQRTHKRMNRRRRLTQRGYGGFPRFQSAHHHNKLYTFLNSLEALVVVIAFVNKLGAAAGLYTFGENEYSTSAVEAE
jgi:hypothetical protein